ncbi:MAG: hypothetical protein QXT53_01280 [Ignisphaera sp.]
MLIPPVASYEKWKQFFKRDIGRALGYCERIVGLYNKLSMTYSDINTKKIVAGIIGKNTIGHWRDIQKIFEEFFGIKCIRCSEIVKDIASGIPYDMVLQKVSLFFGEPRAIREIEALMVILAEIYKNSVIARPPAITSSIFNVDYNTLTSNPLHIIRILRGLYTSFLALLPLYNEFTYFLLITRNMDYDLFKKYFRDLDLGFLSRFGIKYRKIHLCEETAIIGHEKNSAGEKIQILVNNIYRFFKQQPYAIRRFIRVIDEEEKFVRSMIATLQGISTELGIKVSQSLYSSLYRNAEKRYIRAGYTYVETIIRVNRRDCSVKIKDFSIAYKDFVGYMEPYMITGLFQLDNIIPKDDYIDMYAKIYMKPGKTGI